MEFVSNINIEKGKFKVRYSITAGLFLVYAIFMFYAYINIGARVPDEQDFFEIARGITWDNLNQILRTPNYYGYGSIYWIVLRSLNDFLEIRMLNLLAVLLIPISIIYTMGNLLHKDIEEINCALLIYLSTPLAWFTGKIIGPELIGNIIGIAGTTVLIKNENRRGVEKLLFGSIILGIATGIKLNYLIYMEFSYIYLLWKYTDRIQDHIKDIVLDSLVLGIGVIIGYVIANPVILMDFNVFAGNFAGSGRYTINDLLAVIFRESIEWDLVNSGGLTQMVISLFGVIAVFISAIKIDRRRFLAGVASTLTLILICGRAPFRGWYLLPLIFIIPICFCRTRMRYAVIVLNMILMFSPLTYQISSKCDQISNIRNEFTIAKEVKEWEQQYSDYQSYYFIDTCMQYLPFSTYDEHTFEGGG